MPLDVQLGEEVTILHGDAGFGQTGVDDDPLSHGSTSIRGRGERPAGNPAVHWNCRIRTESRSPSAISETTMDDPP